MHNELYTLITGASEGLGKALALECASRGMNIILVALPGAELKNLACYIEKNYGVRVLYFEHDLTKKEEYCKLYEEVKEKNLSVNILINNAGMGGTHFFEEKDAEYYHQQIALNVVAPTLITHLFLGDLENNHPSYILNVSSLASFFYLPKKQVYGGTKSYLVAFSKSLRKELKRKKVYVSTICPGAMNTTLSLILQNRTGPWLGRLSAMNPEDVAKIAMDHMLKRKEQIIPGFLNRFFIVLDKILPRFFKEILTDFQMNRVKVFKNPLMMQTKPGMAFNPPFINPLKAVI